MREMGDVYEPEEDTSKARLLRRRVDKDEESPIHNNDLYEVSEGFGYTLAKRKGTLEDYFWLGFRMDRSNPSSDDSDDESGPSSIVFDENKSNLFGLSNQVSEIIATLRDWKLSQLLFVSLLGMTGIGKTTLAKVIFEHMLILKRFPHRVWVNLGPNYRSKDILRDILAQLDVEIDEMDKRGNLILANHLSNFVSSNRCLFVLDGVWDTNALDYLIRLSGKRFKKGSAVLVTTTLDQVAVFPYSYRVHQMRLLNEDDSWRLLRHKVFDEMPCPRELVKAGKKIAEICEGLPLLIVTVADILSKSDKTLEYWNKVADQSEHLVFINAYDKISEMLLPNYDYLPHHLKEPFLYLGVFPVKNTIHHSEIINLWISEGFLERNFEDVAAKYLKDLISRSVVMVHQQSTSNKIKTCGLHSVFWYLCIKEARKDKFFYIVKRYDDIIAEGVESQPRFCIHNNVLFGIKELNNLLAFTSNVSSLLCTGPYHQYPVPISLDHLRFLKIFYALTIRFYLFPIKVLKLIGLRYLSLTYNGNLPSPISQLSNLECLIVGRPLAITSVEKPLCLPVEIWDMKKLKHLQITGSNQLPDPCEGSFLPNLVTLSGMNAHSCSKSVLESIPNLKKLGIQIELLPDAATNQEPLNCFDHISHLEKLESLKCIIVNPIFKTNNEFVVYPSPPLSVFSSGLKKLSLSGLGYPWEEMGKISLLPNLEVLKLRCYAFRGPKWEVENKRFLRLEFLLIEDSDLVHWTAGNGSFPFLDCLSIKHCYKLRVMPRKFSLDLGKVQVVDCNPSIVKWAKNLTKIDVRVQSSWDER